MADDHTPDTREFAASFKGFMDSMRHAVPDEELALVCKLREHFSTNPTSLPIVSETFAGHDHPNVHLAVETVIRNGDRTFESIGVRATHRQLGVALSDVLAGGPYAAHQGPIEYSNFAQSDGAVLPCALNALFFLKDRDERWVILLRGPIDAHYDDRVSVQVMAADRDAAERMLAEIRTELHRRNVYRGKIVSVEGNQYGRGIALQFHHLPAVDRANIILPQGLLERIERLTVNFGRNRDRLRASGRHLKRGILLHGPPGTGKTLTAMHLARRMEDRTTFLITGFGFKALAQTCALARSLEPSMVILEDVDLIAEDREYADQCSQPLLFELLNEMEGLSNDVDVIFLLTTNRPERLEQALAARPGRVDQAIEVPAPDAECRRKLFALYASGLMLSNDVDLERIVSRTEGVSAAFIRELLRKAALFAADERAVEPCGEDGICVEHRHLDEAMHALMIAGGALTKKLLGVSQSLAEQ